MKDTLIISEKVKKILVVDDSELLHRMYDLIFLRCRNNGIRIFHAYNGEEALSNLEEHPDTDLVILDMHMPVMDGLQFLRHHSKERTFQKIPVIVTGTQGKEEETKDGLRAGAQGYLVKPFQAENLYKVINKVFYEDKTTKQESQELAANC